MTRAKIISLGEVLWDLFPEAACLGGAPANFACHAAAMGGDLTVISAVGEDSRGYKAIEILGAYGIQTDLIQILADAPTGTVGIALDEAGKPTFAIHECAAWDRVAWSPEIENRVRTADAVYFGTLGQRSAPSRTTIRRILDLARAVAIPRILDVNLRAPFFDDVVIRESIDYASVLKLSDDELPITCIACDTPLSKDPVASLRQLRERSQLDLVVMTCGAEGALLVSRGETVDQPGVPTTVKDTVGAGDSFTAALVVGLLRGERLDTLLETACRFAANVCSQAGAVPPTVRPFG